MPDFLSKAPTPEGGLPSPPSTIAGLKGGEGHHDEAEDHLKDIRG